MGCFNTCFGSSNHNKSPKPQTTTLAQVLQKHQKCEPIPIDQQSNTVHFIKPVSESKDKNEDQLDNNITKKVTFDLDIKSHDDEFSKCSLEIEKEKENGNQENTEILQSQTLSYPPKHRYHNCTSSDGDDMELEDTDSNIDDYDHIPFQPESSGSLFSLSIESRNYKNTLEIGEKEVSSPLKSVLKPVENLSQWKEVKARATISPPLKDQEKENINSHQEPNNIPSSQELDFMFSNHNLKDESEIEVDTSLSSWLVGSEKLKTPTKKEGLSSSSIGNLSSEKAVSSKRFEDRPILGALTVEELKQLSAKSTPRKSPSRSPDEMPIIGTVGSYWSHTGQTTDSYSTSSTKRISSKFIEDKRVNCNSTPFATRLERTLDRGIA